MSERKLPEGYRHVPVSVAGSIAETYDKTHVVIICFDERINMFHTVTFGLRDERDKQNAAAIGDHLTRYLGGEPDLGQTFEAFAGEAGARARAAEARVVELATRIGMLEGGLAQALVTCEREAASPEDFAEVATLQELMEGKARH